MREAEIHRPLLGHKKVRFSEAELIDRRSCSSSAEQRIERQL
jgi:hypothetical protein